MKMRSSRVPFIFLLAAGCGRLRRSRLRPFCGEGKHRNRFVAAWHEARHHRRQLLKLGSGQAIEKRIVYGRLNADKLVEQTARFWRHGQQNAAPIALVDALLDEIRFDELRDLDRDESAGQMKMFGNPADAHSFFALQMGDRNQRRISDPRNSQSLAKACPALADARAECQKVMDKGAKDRVASSWHQFRFCHRSSRHSINSPNLKQRFI
ncbi:MAG TPA: hypothetical protein VNQ34_01895 [Xanthobacteraceae bacterium]|nr:hypothetical protein [Xanthobacteraceae bacterium]